VQCANLSLISEIKLTIQFSTQYYFRFSNSNFTISLFVPVTGYDLSTLKSILQSSSLEYVVVITNCHPTVHTWSLHPAKDWNIEDRSWFDKLEEQVLMWMGNVNLTADIFHLPLLMVTPTFRVLLIPTYYALVALVSLHCWIKG
jgi:hypothetical protein